MKIVFDRDEMLEAVTPMLGVVSGKNTSAALEGVLIDARADGSCVLSGYDSEKGVRNSISASVSEQGAYIINASKFASILRSMPDGGIAVEVSERNLTRIYRGLSSFELHALPGSDFPNLPDLDGVNGFEIARSELRSVLSKIAFAVATKDARPELNGAFFSIKGDRVTVVGCDSDRLALHECVCEIKYIDGTEPLPEEIKFILPTRAMNELAKLLGDEDEPVRVMMGRKHVIFSLGGLKFFSRVIDSEYIDYARLIPKESPVTVNIARDALQRSLERASLVTEDSSLGQTKSPLRCHFSEDVLQLSSVSISGRFSEEIPINMTGGELDIAFNCRYFLDAVRTIDRENIKLSLTSSLGTMIIGPSDIREEADDKDKFLYLVVPVRARA